MQIVTLEFRPKYVTEETQYALYCALQTVFEGGGIRPVEEIVMLRNYFKSAITATERLRVRMTFDDSVAMARRFSKDARLRNGYDVRFSGEQQWAA